MSKEIIYCQVHDSSDALHMFKNIFLFNHLTQLSDEKALLFQPNLRHFIVGVVQDLTRCLIFASRVKRKRIIRAAAKCPVLINSACCG